MESVPVEDSISPSESQPIIRSASELQVGDRVVYPNQGVCRVQGTESKEIAGTTLSFVLMTREEDNATILVPVSKIQSIGLRKVAGSVEIEDAFDLLASSFEDPELDWKVRHRHHVDLLAGGELLGVAEVVKALQGIANLRPLPQRERERYDAARRLLEDEVSVSLGVPLATAEDLIDFALIPPPGTIREPRKPRRLAEIPTKSKAARPRRRPVVDGEDEELPLEELEEELVEEEPLDSELLEVESAEEEEELEEEPAPEPPRKAAAKKEKAAKPRSRATAKKTAEKAPAPKAKTGSSKKVAEKSTATAKTAEKAPARAKSGTSKKTPAKSRAKAATKKEDRPKSTRAKAGKEGEES